MLDYCKRQQNFNSSERPFKWQYFDFVVSPVFTSPHPPWNYNPYVKRDSMPPRACRPTLRKGTWSLYMKSVDAHRLAINITNTNGPMQETKQIKEILMILTSTPLKAITHFLFQSLCCLSRCATPQLIKLYRYKSAILLLSCFFISKILTLNKFNWFHKKEIFWLNVS